MAYYLVKVALSALMIVLISETARRFPVAGGLLASLPVVSILSMIWIYVETRDVETISRFSTSVFWLVIPSLVLFILLPWLLRHQLPFYAAIALASLATIVAYTFMLVLLRTWGIHV